MEGGIRHLGMEMALRQRKLHPFELRCKASWKKELKLPWREAGLPNHQDDKVDSYQWVVNDEHSLSFPRRSCLPPGSKRFVLILRVELAILASM